MLQNTYFDNFVHSRSSWFFPAEQISLFEDDLVFKRTFVRCVYTCFSFSGKQAFACKLGFAYNEASSAFTLAYKNMERKSVKPITFMGLPFKQSYCF